MNQLDALFQQSTDAVFGVDRRGTVRFWNENCEKLLGYTREQTCDMPCRGLFCDDEFLDHSHCKERCLDPAYFATTALTKDRDHIVRRASGEPTLVSVGACYIPDSAPGEASVYFSLRQIDCRRLIQRLGSGICTPLTPPSRDRRHGLTEREKEILKLAASGLRTHHISDRLCISAETVRNHFKHIYPKLGVHSRTEAVSLAMRHNLI